MKILTLLGLLCSLHIVVGAKNLVCYYDASSYTRPGFAKLQPHDIDMALQFCTHLIYGYAGLTHNTHEIRSLNTDVDMFYYREITNMKTRYPHLKVLLSVGGDRDVDEAYPQKYIEFLESGPDGQQNFIESSIALLRRNNFDGLDLAFQLPRNKPRKVHGAVGTYWKKFKKLFTGDFIVDAEAEAHKQQYTVFVKNLKNAFLRTNLSLTMTVLPNVNSTWYFNVPEIANAFDMINLAAFDFLTPQRNPEEADYTAPIYPLLEQNRLPHYNIEFQVNYWLENKCPAHKLNLGIATYGRAWKMTTDSGPTGEPVVPDTGGPAPAGLQSQKEGLLSWPEICAKVPSTNNLESRGENAPLRKVSDLQHRYGNYALRPADDDGEFGMWVSYDDPDFAGLKANYAKQRGLGGVAIFDLSYDDFRGLCTGQRYPILRMAALSL